jgi:hypothetical protein
MADYGLSVTNNGGSVIISNLYKIMVFSERGSFRITSSFTDRGGQGSYVFTKPIKTQEPPQLFFGNLSGLHPKVSVYITLIGGPGNWTGFVANSAIAGGNNLQNTYVEFVACKYCDTPNPNQYGMNQWDANGNILYSSEDRVVRYSKFAKNWTFVSGNEVFTYRSNVALDADDFICISAFDRGVTWFIGFDFAGMTILDNGVPTLNITVNLPGGGNAYPYGANTSFCVPVCKFPAARYHN